ncbi:MAG: dTDP-4-dehydrorhamnose 3,5-epimerase [Chloroflexi bacterium HGW-Chloroflexi-6]|nr:MAG: dTDP-4-dehydrorhamnose 3,5-epimerase [Chloroflexi bacterium HGW-Chloroflexi-6]
MEYTPLEISDVILVQPRVFQDERGFFLESYKKTSYASAGISLGFVQSNHSGSKQGVLRGLHYQVKNTQGKLVCAVLGEIFDVAVDLRRNSPTFGKWVGAYLSAEKKNQLWIPPGFAHGFYAVSSWAEVFYQATDFYAPESERTLLWNDPQVAIQWPIENGQMPILSPKDADGVPLAQADLFG